MIMSLTVKENLRKAYDDYQKWMMITVGLVVLKSLQNIFLFSEDLRVLALQIEYDIKFTTLIATAPV